jgi:hypothetical protein
MPQTTDYQTRVRAIREARLRLKEAEEAHIAALRSATEDLARAKREREKVLKEARSQLRSATSGYDSRVAAAKKKVEAARDGELLARLGSVRLFNNRLEAPEGTVPLSSDIKASVEISAPTQKGKSPGIPEGLLLLSTPRFDSVISFRGVPTATAHQVAANINTAAKNASESLRTYQLRLDAAEKEFEQTGADRSEIERATARLAEVEVDTETVEQAQAKLTAAEAGTGTLEARRSELLALDPTAEVRTIKAPSEWLAGARPLIWWRERSKPARVALITGGSLFGLLVLLIVIGSVVGSSSSSKTATKKPTLALSLVQPKGARDTTTEATYKIVGTASGDARVTVNGKASSRLGRQFSLVVPLSKGENAINVRAVRSGSPEKIRALTIVRQLPPVTLTILGDQNVTVRQPTYIVRGRVTPGARVKVAGRTASTTGGHFALSVQLGKGENVIGVKADKSGLASRYTRITVVRRLSAAEISQQRVARRQAFMNTCTTIPFNQLDKNADGYAGKRVKYYGEIFQIQESYGGGMMLLSVTDMGYDIWSDEIWVNYTGHVRGAEGDKLTVYGTVVGSKTYKTQIGGERYVPEIDAKYVVE